MSGLYYIKFFGGDLDDDIETFRCDLSQKSSPLQYFDESDEYLWSDTSYKCSDFKDGCGDGSYSMVDVCKKILANLVGSRVEEFTCKHREGFGDFLVCRNAYELADAAFDSACDFAEETIDYIKAYAEGAFDIEVSDTVAKKILSCRKKLRMVNENSNEVGHNYDTYYEFPLRAIEVNEIGDLV